MFDKSLYWLGLAAALTAAGCGADPHDAPAPEGPAGQLELPLEALAEDGTPVRLVGAALQLETPADTVPVVAPADEGVFSLALPLDLRRVTLTGPWHLEAMDAGAWHPIEGRLLSSPDVAGPLLVNDEVTEIGFRFDSTHGPITLGSPR